MVGNSKFYIGAATLNSHETFTPNSLVSDSAQDMKKRTWGIQVSTILTAICAYV